MENVMRVFGSLGRFHMLRIDFVHPKTLVIFCDFRMELLFNHLSSTSTTFDAGRTQDIALWWLERGAYPNTTGSDH